MRNDDLIEIDDFCNYHDIELSFIDSLEESGLVECIIINDKKYIHNNQLQEVEKIIRLHQDLEINISGVEAIVHLLQQIEKMQFEITFLRNKLIFYS